MKQWCVYIVTNKPYGVLYIGITQYIQLRSHQHATSRGAAFTKKYNCNHLVYIEYYETKGQALARERQLKNWKRSWKTELIEKQNPEWKNYLDGEH